MKDKILEKAAELFNESGIHQTSFRTIASGLGLSDGHVRYYYKTKEKLLLAIFEKMNEEILLTSRPIPEDTAQISRELKTNLNDAFTIMSNYSFFFTETPATFNQFAEVRKIYRNIIQNRKDLFMNLFQQLIARGYFKDDFSSELQHQAFYSIFIISDSWIRFHSILHNQKPDLQTIQFHSELAFNILLPYINGR